MTTPRDPIYAGHRCPAEIISYAIRLYFRLPLSLRMVEEMLAARRISVTHETIQQRGLKFGREFANAPAASASPWRQMALGHAGSEPGHRERNRSGRRHARANAFSRRC
jgi:hypothetical protein